MLGKCDVRQEGAKAAPASSMGPVIVAIRIAAVAGLVGFCFVLPLVQFAMCPSAEAAIADADKTNRRELSYSLESERTEPDGSVVYRLVSDSDPPVYREQRYRFRWFPEMNTAPGAPIPSTDMPDPCYELANGDEFRRALAEWSRKRMDGKAESGGGLSDGRPTSGIVTCHFSRCRGSQAGRCEEQQERYCDAHRVGEGAYKRHRTYWENQRSRALNIYAAVGGSLVVRASHRLLLWFCSHDRPIIGNPIAKTSATAFNGNCFNSI